jgi:hypothetical protein
MKYEKTNRNFTLLLSLGIGDTKLAGLSFCICMFGYMLIHLPFKPLKHYMLEVQDNE